MRTINTFVKFSAAFFAGDAGSGAEDGAGEVPGAEAVVDIDDGQAGRAGVQHGQEGGQPFEGRAIAYGRRDSHYGRGDEAGDDGG